MNPFIIFLALSIATHAVRTTYEILKLRNKINPESKPLFIFMFSNMVVLWISWFGLCENDPYAVSLNPVFTYSGAVLVIFGAALFLISLVKVKKLENYHGALITDGIYKFLRHPMYLSFILLLAGGLLFYGSVFGLILAVFDTANILYWRRIEEIHLMKEFPEYEEYRRRTYF